MTAAVVAIQALHSAGPAWVPVAEKGETHWGVLVHRMAGAAKLGRSRILKQ